jgi:hypothetical protein
MPPWRPDSPVELPDGRLVCKMHELTICGICTVDYSFMDDILNEDGTDSALKSDSHDSMPTLEDIGDDIRHDVAEDFDETYEGVVRFGLLAGQVKPDVSTFIPQRFVPSAPTDTPQSLFVARMKKGMKISLYNSPPLLPQTFFICGRTSRSEIGMVFVDLELDLDLNDFQAFLGFTLASFVNQIQKKS